MFCVLVSRCERCVLVVVVVCALTSIPGCASGRAWSFLPWKIPLGRGLRHAGILGREMVGFLCVLLSLTALQVEGFSGGGSSIASQCGSMLPGNSFHGSTGQISSSPYTVTVNQTTYQPGDTIQVTLSGTFTYKGFLLEAHEEGQNKAVGMFSLGSGTGIILVPCNGIAASGVSQSNNQPRSSVTVTWTAPYSSSLGNIIVK
ncbi:putative ferric-chelate reductase 1 isoform X2 [Oncorhynchus tshawytscha]|uniref:putative ferric-chelate reductase 1 isoform X2 n=1 Tax=Oncorhynchus tshawytscha TaxID=74940 RepID=UPI001C3CAA9F|nr:putative ferric-chelate reductase 1 isoform X2 [Oncorhynchus tshawytscha]